MEEIISVKNISKSFKTFEDDAGSAKSLFNRRYYLKKVLNDVSFTIKKGEIIALLGRNGSGKSTLVKILTGIIQPDKGSVTILNLNPAKERIELDFKIGVVFGATHPQLFWDLPPIDTFNYIKGIYGIPDRQFKERLDRLIEMLSLETAWKRQTRQLSLGERMKCEFIAAILHSPELVIMDEPTIGVDLPSRTSIAKAMLKMRSDFNTTFIITTHVVEDIGNSDRIILLNHGEKVFDGSQKAMRNMLKKTVVLELYFSNPADIKKYLRFGKPLTIKENYLKLQIEPSSLKHGWFIKMLKNKSVVDYRISEPGLAFILNKIYERIDRNAKRK
ncbi:MAG: ATP-binding cassette domain-containing protein [Candidatus Marsarchaeota archaeon]|nr:ATP-binding cassette domain-containing protein [Candidatus Marsarchaeota archaeon]